MSATTKPTTFICGATGTQGGVLASRLLSQGLPIHCLVRDPSSAAAQSLLSRGARIFPGSFDDVPALRTALAGCTTVFLNFSPQFRDFPAELRWATSILSIAGEVGATHAIYSSALCSDDLSAVKGLKSGSLVANVLGSKNNIEKEVMSAKYLPTWTVLRPANFMSNYIDPFARFFCPDLVNTGTWRTPNDPSTILTLIDPETIGKFTAAAVTNPDKYDKQAISYADQNLSAADMLEALKKATGREDLRMESMSEEEIEEQSKVNPIVEGQQLLKLNAGEGVDLEDLKKWGIELSTFDKFLEREKSRVLATYTKIGT
ncbi:nmrA-like family protein [Sarocladium implicatum]|nr:nmrA-like family protein [Sarocladium implicatum]